MIFNSYYSKLSINFINCLYINYSFSQFYYLIFLVGNLITYSTPIKTRGNTMASNIDFSTISVNDDLTPLLGDYWPGIQFYYPPIKFNPLDGSYESMEQAQLRLQKHAINFSCFR